MGSILLEEPLFLKLVKDLRYCVLLELGLELLHLSNHFVPGRTSLTAFQYVVDKVSGRPKLCSGGISTTQQINNLVDSTPDSCLQRRHLPHFLTQRDVKTVA